MIVRRLPSSFVESVKRQLAERGDPPDGPHPSKLIDELIRSYLAPLMKAQGFRKSGQNFWREENDTIDVLTVQKSQWNDAWSASFYVNLGVYWKAFHRDEGSEYTSAFPREYDCTVFSRVLEPEENSWTMQPDSDLSRVGNTLVRAVQESAFSWFKEMHTYSGTLNQLRVQRIADKFESWLASKSRTGGEVS